MTKKLISMLLSIAMVLSVAVVGISGVYAAIDNDDRYVPSEGTATKRLYFVMPESWKNEKFGADSAGIFWWNGSDACVFNGGSSQAAPWPGYKMQVYDADANIFYIDIPSDVPAIIFNNCLNGGEREEDAETGKVTFEFGEEQFKAAMQTRMCVVITIRKVTVLIMTNYLTVNSGQRLRRLLRVMIRHSSATSRITSLSRQSMTSVSQ